MKHGLVDWIGARGSYRTVTNQIVYNINVRDFFVFFDMTAIANAVGNSDVNAFLPLASLVPRQLIVIKRGEGNQRLFINVAPGSSNLIDGEPSKNTKNDYAAWLLFSDGQNKWHLW